MGISSSVRNRKLQRKKGSARRLAILWLYVFPFVCLAITAVLAGPVSLAEGGEFKGIFLFLLQTMTGSSIALTDYPGPTGTFGIAIANITLAGQHWHV